MQPSHQTPPLAAVYVTPTPDAAIPLVAGDMAFTQGGYTGNGQGSIQVVWSPSPRIRFEIPLLNPPGIINLGLATLQFQNGLGSGSVDVTSVHNTMASIFNVGVQGRPVESLCVQQGQDAAYAIFHLVNYWRYLNPRPTPAPPEYNPGRLVFAGGGWRVTLQAVPNSKELAQALRAESGCALTHVGRIERTDSTLFTLEQSRNLFAALHVFLSFSSGIWSPPILYVGFNATGATVWHDWSVRSATPWKDRYSWFPEHSPQCLADVFPGFMQLWQNPDWNEIVKVAIHWYVEANLGSGAIEGAVVMGQTAFELLAWYILVEDRQRLSNSAFGNLNAADQMRALFNEFALPLAIPLGWRRISDLPQLAASQGWADAPQALTVLRNSIVHPSRRNQARLQTYPIRARWESWQLGLWYLEVILLKLFGYAGQYANRLRIQATGEVETSP
jgi:hypothetical protein